MVTVINMVESDVVSMMGYGWPTHDRILSLITRDAAKHSVNVSRAEATYVDDMFTCAVSEIRSGKPMYLLNNLDLQMALTIIETIMPDESQPEPGSAHQALGFRHLRDEDGELYFKRTFIGKLDDNTRHPALTIVTKTEV